MGQKFSNIIGIVVGHNKLKMERKECDQSEARDTKNINTDSTASVEGRGSSNSGDNIIDIYSALPGGNIKLSDAQHVNTSKNNCDKVREECNFTNTARCKFHDDEFVDVEKPRIYKPEKKKSLFPIKDRCKKKKNHWVLRFNCTRIRRRSSNSGSPIGEKLKLANTCVCTGYKKTESINSKSDSQIDLALVPLLQEQDDAEQVDLCCGSGSYIQDSSSKTRVAPVIDLSKFNPEDFPIEDCDEQARLERAREIAEGVDAPPGFSPNHALDVVCNSEVLSIDNLTAIFRSALSLSALSQIEIPRPVHTQIDYIHCLVPDLLQVTSCSFYWGKMDRYEAEHLLENKPEGTFLLRDSAQEEYLFSVSFRKYGRSLHARIEQWNHRFSFDSHDPGVFASSTVCGLIEHYKDPTCCMFFEPMLTIPLHRNFTFPLQHLCRSVICDHLKYDSINVLKLPKALKLYLKEYHYKQRVRVRKFDTDP